MAAGTGCPEMLRPKARTDRTIFCKPFMAMTQASGRSQILTATLMPLPVEKVPAGMSGSYRIPAIYNT
jgi:hypothetical protein